MKLSSQVMLISFLLEWSVMANVAVSYHTTKPEFNVTAPLFWSACVSLFVGGFASAHLEAYYRKLKADDR